MVKLSAGEIVSMLIALVLIAFVLPVGLGLVGAFGDYNVTINGTSQAISTILDANVITLVETVVPIMAILSIVMGFLPRFKQ